MNWVVMLFSRGLCRVNLSPNKVNEQCVFYDEIRNELAKVEADADHRIIIGSDFNVILDPDYQMDREGNQN